MVKHFAKWAKKQRDNISDKELIRYRRRANFYAELDHDAITENGRNRAFCRGEL